MPDAPLDAPRWLDIGDELGTSFDLPKLGEDGGVVPNGVNGVAGLRKVSPHLEGVVRPASSLNGEPAQVCGASCSSSPRMVSWLGSRVECDGTGGSVLSVKLSDS